MPRYSSRTGQLQEYQVGPFSSEHWYVQWGGKLPTDESWSCGLRMALKAGGTHEQATTPPTAITNAVQAFHTRAQTYISAPAQLSFIKMNVIKTDGTYREPGTAELVVADVAGGGPAAAPYPHQVALAVSLTTGFSRGPAHRGRFYLPLPGQIIDATGSIMSSYMTDIKNSSQTFIDALNAWTINAEVVVMSRKAGAPAKRAVTGVEVGRILDTQRRRRRSLLEQYV